MPAGPVGVKRTHTPVNMQPKTGDRDGAGDAKLKGRPSTSAPGSRQYTRPAAKADQDGVLVSQTAK